MSSSGPLLQAHELYRFYHAGDDETFALRGVSLSVGAGEMLAVVGPSGSGKSTLLGCLAGLDDPDGGYVEVAGRRISRKPEAERSKLRAARIGMLMQSGNLLDHLTVSQNIDFARRLSAGPASAKTDELLARVGLADKANVRPTKLSGGEAARAGLAVAIAGEPEILLADEPTAEVDETHGEVLTGLLRGVAERGGAVVVATHSSRLAGQATAVIHLDYGKVVDE